MELVLYVMRTIHVFYSTCTEVVDDVLRLFRTLQNVLYLSLLISQIYNPVALEFVARKSLADYLINY